MPGTGNLANTEDHEIMDVGEEPTTTNLLNQHNPQLHSKYFPSYPQLSIAIKEMFLEKKKEPIMENQNH